MRCRRTRFAYLEASRTGFPNRGTPLCHIWLRHRDTEHRTCTSRGEPGRFHDRGRKSPATCHIPFRRCGRRWSQQGLAPDGVGYENPDSRRSSRPPETFGERRNRAVSSPGAGPRADHRRRPRARGRGSPRSLSPEEPVLGLDLALVDPVVPEGRREDVERRKRAEPLGLRSQVFPDHTTNTTRAPKPYTAPTKMQQPTAAAALLDLADDERRGDHGGHPGALQAGYVPHQPSRDEGLCTPRRSPREMSLSNAAPCCSSASASSYPWEVPMEEMPEMKRRWGRPGSRTTLLSSRKEMRSISSDPDHPSETLTRAPSCRSALRRTMVIHDDEWHSPPRHTRIESPGDSGGK
mgnify:CR=1 FL=1